MWKNQLNTYLTVAGVFSFANACSGIFLGIFLWKLDPTYKLLSLYSLSFALLVLLSFPFCAWVARKTSPMTALRIGVGCAIVAYAMTLYFQNAITHHVIALGFWMGLQASLFAVGMHMTNLDLNQNENRDRYLYTQGFINSLGGMIAPILAGSIITISKGIVGYYIVFGLSCTMFILCIVLSFRVQTRPLHPQSFFREVLKHPTKEWKWMAWITFGDGFVSGTYATFLINLMTYHVVNAEIGLGGFKSIAGIMALFASLLLAKISGPYFRIYIYSIGAILLAASSGLLSLVPTIAILVVFSIIQPVASNMIAITINAWTYASIESDPQFKERRLDYIIIREIPLGIGRTLGILLFLWMRSTFSLNHLLIYSFSLFPIVYLILVPVLWHIWKKERGIYKNENKSELENSIV